VGKRGGLGLLERGAGDRRVGGVVVAAAASAVPPPTALMPTTSAAITAALRVMKRFMSVALLSLSTTVETVDGRAMNRG
jgi:hypothetical protein